MIVDSVNWNRFFKGATISRSLVIDANRYMFVLSENANPENPDAVTPTRFIEVHRERPMEQRFSGIKNAGFEFPRIAKRQNSKGAIEIVAVDMHGLVYVKSDTHEGSEKHNLLGATAWKTRKGHTYAGAALTNVRNVNHEIVVVGLDHFIFRRQGPDSWEPFPGIERPADRDRNPKANNLAYGFEDISAFGPEDVYAAGGHGDVWRYDGQSWTHCDFPSNEPLHTVCCAGNGKVYLTGLDGSVWAGREDTWKAVVHPGTFSLRFDHALWFADRMWFGMDYGLFELKNKELVRVDFDEATFGKGMMSGDCDVSLDGKYLLTSNQYGAALFDGKVWEPLFNASLFEPDQFEDESEDE